MLFESAKRLERIELPAASCGVAELADESVFLQILELLTHIRRLELPDYSSDRLR
jgi:hypothetical protein